MEINWIDILLILVVAASAASGWYRGFIIGTLDLVRWVGSWLTALLLYRTIANWLDQITDWSDTWRLPISFLLLIRSSQASINLAGGQCLDRTRREHHESRLNRT